MLINNDSHPPYAKRNFCMYSKDFSDQKLSWLFIIWRKTSQDPIELNGDSVQNLLSGFIVDWIHN